MKAKNTNTPITTNPQVEDSSAEHIETVHSDLDQIQRRKKKRELRKKDWAILKRFISYSLQYKKTLILAILSIPLLTFFSVAVPWIVVQISDQIILHKDLAAMKFWVGVLLASLLVSILFEFIYSFSLQFIAQKSIVNMRQDLFARILQFPKAFFDKEPLGRLLSRLTSDFENVQESLAIGVLTFLVDLIKTIFLFILLYFLNWRLAIIVSLFFPLIGGVAQFVRSLMREAYLIARAVLAKAAAYLGECIQGMQTVQLYLAEEKVLQSYQKRNNEFFRQQKNINKYESFLTAFIEGISILCILVVLWYAAHLSIRELISISVVIAFMNSLQKCFIPIRELFQQVSTIQRALSSLDQIENLFRKKIEPEPILDKPLTKLEKITFKNVSFRYPDTSKYVLKNISFNLHSKQKLALVGATGSGKSSILRVLSKQYEDYEGSIKINGIELKEIPRKTLLDFASIQFQDTYLFNESVEFNVNLAQKEISKKNVLDALKYVDALDFIKKLKGGLNFQIIDNGKNLSSGQAQLISLARIVAQKKELFLLDEATSTVDSITTNKINKAIKKIFSQKTVIAIAHQLSTIQQSDIILFLKNGKITERGTHQGLLKKKGSYFALVQSSNKK